MKARRELRPLQDTRCVVFAADVSSAEISGFNWHQQYFVVLLQEIRLKTEQQYF